MYLGYFWQISNTNFFLKITSFFSRNFFFKHFEYLFFLDNRNKITFEKFVIKRLLIFLTKFINSYFQDSITYHDSKYSTTISPEILASHSINCVNALDKSRYLCGDTLGTIFLLVLDYDETRPEGNRMKLVLQALGHTTLPHCISYIDNYVVFIGKF